jgi:hypothetical protein
MSAEPLLLLVVGFVLTTVAGGALASMFQKRSWDHQHKVERDDLEREQALKTFEEVSVLLDQRLYRMRQVYWAAKHRALGGDRVGRLNSALTAYTALLQQWNDNLNRILALVHTYFGEPIRMRLQVELYATYAAIGEELERFVSEVSQPGNGRVRVRPIGIRLNDLEHRVYCFNVEILRAFRDERLGVRACQGGAFVMSQPILPRFGVEGGKVTEIQQALRREGSALVVDGHFGYQTELALMEFQRSHDLTPDGVAGPLTLAALGISA